MATSSAAANAARFNAAIAFMPPSPDNRLLRTSPLHAPEGAPIAPRLSGISPSFGVRARDPVGRRAASGGIALGGGRRGTVAECSKPRTARVRILPDQRAVKRTPVEPSERAGSLRAAMKVRERWELSSGDRTRSKIDVQRNRL